MPAKSRKARSESLTRYSTGAPEFFQRFLRWTHAAFLEVLDALPDTFVFVGSRSDIQETLIRLSVLHYRFRLAVNRKDHRLLGLLKLFQELRWIAAKRGHCLYISFEIEHSSCPSIPAWQRV